MEGYGSSYRLGFLALGTFLFLCGQFHDAALYNWEGVHDAGNRRPETAVMTGKNSVIERTPCVHLCTPSELGSRKGSQGPQRLGRELAASGWARTDRGREQDWSDGS